MLRTICDEIDAKRICGGCGCGPEEAFTDALANPEALDEYIRIYLDSKPNIYYAIFFPGWGGATA
jgi:hypothetical protein